MYDPSLTHSANACQTVSDAIEVSQLEEAKVYAMLAIASALNNLADSVADRA